MVNDGQKINASVTNSAFISRTSDSNTTGVVSLDNTSDVDSGASVPNTQQAHNETFDAVGMTGIDDTTRKDYSSNEVVTNGDSHKVAIGKVDAEFNNATGHAHSGSAGDGTPISVANVANLNQYFAYWQSVTEDSITGSSATLSGLAGETPGGDDTSEGVITTTPNNRVAIYEKTTGVQFTDPQGQVVYGRITYSAPNFTISFYTNEVGVETTYNFSTTEDIIVFYLEVFNQGTRPTIQATPEFGTLDVTAEVVDATEFVRGVVNTNLQTFGGDKTFSSGLRINNRFELGKVVDSTSSGADITIGAASSNFAFPITSFTGAITSIAGIEEDGRTKQVWVINNSGGTVTLKHDSAAATLNDRIIIGGGNDISWPDGQAYLFVYEDLQDRWFFSGQQAGNLFTPQAFGSTPNANGFSYDSVTGNFNLQPASGAQPGAVSTAAQVLAGQKEFQDGVKLDTKVVLDSSDDSTSTGASAVLTITDPLTYVSNASLASVGGINQINSGEEAEFILSNKTGAAIQVNNEDTGVTANTRILTGTGGTITLADDASLTLVYDNADSRWKVIGGTGSGTGGVLNFIDGGDAETSNPFATYADAAGTSPVDGTGGSPNITAASITSTSPLSGIKSFLLSKDSAANRQGEGWSIDFDIDSAHQAKMLKVSFDYLVTAGSFAAATNSTDSDVTVWVYDVTNSRIINTSDKKMYWNSSSVPGHYESEFQASPDSTSYRLIFHLGTTATTALTLKVDSVVTTPSQGPLYGANMSDIEDNWTPTASWVSNITWTGKIKRMGDTARLYFSAALTNTTEATDLVINLPYTIDTSKLLRTDSDSWALPGSVNSREGGTSQQHHGSVNYLTSTSVKIWAPNAASTYLQGGSAFNSTVPFTWGNTDFLEGWVDIPVLGWSSTNKVANGYDGIGVEAEYEGAPPTGTLAAAFNKVTFGTKNVDSTNMASAGVFTIPASGKYSMMAQAAVTGTYVAGNITAIGVAINGTMGKYSQEIAYGAVGTLTPKFVLQNAVLAAGDTVEFRVYTDASGPTYASSAALNYCTIHKENPAQNISATDAVTAKYYNNAGTSITTTQSTLVFPTLDFDTTDSFASGLFTAPQAGIYQVNVTLFSSSTIPVTQAWLVEGVKTGGTVQFANAKVGTGATNTQNSLSASGLIQLDAGEQCWVESYVDSGSSIALNTATNFNHISIIRVG